jgi:hypothetical protein
MLACYIASSGNMQSHQQDPRLCHVGGAAHAGPQGHPGRLALGLGAGLPAGVAQGLQGASHWRGACSEVFALQ